MGYKEAMLILQDIRKVCKNSKIRVMLGRKQIYNIFFVGDSMQTYTYIHIIIYLYITYGSTQPREDIWVAI